MIRLLLATLLGGVIGLIRELHGQPAGFRTHLMVALGLPCIWGTIHFYHECEGMSGDLAVRGDPGRVAAQIVAGICFLGARAIIRENASVRGLTTAACLWVQRLSLQPVVLECCWLPWWSAISSICLLVLKRVEEGLSRDTY